MAMERIYVTTPQIVLKGAHQGENLARCICFPIDGLKEQYGEGTWTIVFRRPFESDPYVVANQEEVGEYAVWGMDATDTAVAGEGRVELRYYVDDTLCKTDVYAVLILPSLGTTGDAPSPYEDIIDTVAGYAAEARDAADEAGSVVSDALAEMQAELDQAISGVTVDSEVINARVDADGTTYSTLKQRLDAENTELKTAIKSITIFGEDLTWERKLIGDNGVISDSTYVILSDYIPVENVDIIYNGGSTFNGATTIARIAEYSENEGVKSFIRRTDLTLDGASVGYVPLQNETTHIRLSFGHTTSSGVHVPVADSKYCVCGLMRSTNRVEQDIENLQTLIENAEESLSEDVVQLRHDLDNDDNLFVSEMVVGNLKMDNRGATSTISEGEEARSLAIQVEPNTKYRISADVTSHKQAGVFGSRVASGLRADAFANQAVATKDDLFITTLSNSHWLLVQFFTNADTGLTASDFYPTLCISKVTAQDDILRSKALYEHVSIPGHTLEVGGISASNGMDSSSNYVCRTVGFIDTFSLPENFIYTGPKKFWKNNEEITVTCYVYEYATDATGTGKFLRRKRIIDNWYDRSPDCMYVRFTIGFTTSSGVAINTNDAYNIFKLSTIKRSWITDELIGKMSWRMANMLAKARQLSSFGYIPLATIPNQTEDMATGTFYHGVPYSSVRALDTFIGQNISMNTFATMLHNPHSVLYTRKSTNSNSKTYVGIVCSSLVAYCLGLDFPYTTRIMRNSPDYVVHDFWDIDIGDIMINEGHGILICYIEKDEYSRPITIGVVQAAPPRVYYLEYTPEDLKNFIDRNNYEIYSFVGKADNGYEPCQYVKGFPDEVLDLTYPDIMSEYGDKAVIKAGENVLISVLQSAGYSSIEIYKDGTLVETKSIVDDFTIENIDYGTWEIKLVGDGVSSSTQFIAVDISGISYDSDSKIVTFSSANATPIGINNYGANGGLDGDVIKLSEDDVSRGYYDVSSIITENAPYIRVALKTDWGQTAWRSYDLHLWENVT